LISKALYTEESKKSLVYQEEGYAANYQHLNSNSKDSSYSSDADGFSEKDSIKNRDKIVTMRNK